MIKKDSLKLAMEKYRWIAQGGMKQKLGIRMVCGIKNGCQPLTAAQGNGLLKFYDDDKTTEFFS